MKVFQTALQLGFLFVIIPNIAIAQITPDNTVGTQITKGALNDVINGGTIRGNNLFHSFSEFNINTSHGAYFTNPIDVTNIFTRVTGANPTNINGTLGVLGNANLFLMNPNGIVFGTAAKLDLKGSFFGTTANNIKFADGSEYTISNQNVPVLSISVPVGLGFGSNSGVITNQSRTTNSNGQIVGLQVQPNQTLGLIGGEVTSSGGYLTAPSGRIELGSVGAGNQVNLTPHNNSFALGYTNVNNFQDIKLTNAASVNASGVGGGEIQIVGRQVKVRDGSQVINQTQGSQPGGMLTVRASELVELSGTTPDLTKQSADGFIASGLITTTVGTGDAGAIKIDTNRLTVQGGAVILTSSFAGGNSGKININTSDLVELDGIAYTNEFLNRVRQGKPQWFDIRNGIRTEVWNTGNSGEITIETNKLIARGGAQISSGSSNPSGTANGNAASLTINARDAIELSGFSPDGRLTTVLLSGTLGTGAGSNLNINTKQLTLRDGGALNSGTSGRSAGGDLTVNAESIEMTGARSNITSGAGLIRVVTGLSGQAPAGNATINTRSLTVRDGAQIFTATGGASAGGSLTINASEKVQVSGVSADGKLISGILGDARGSGNAGSVRINTNKLVVSDFGRIGVDSTGTGNAGNLEIVANSIQLNNFGNINAATSSGSGGNIILKARELQLRNNSSITATAGNNGNGGNININAGAIALLNNSDITANAVLGIGGNINISTQGIFRSADSDITASSLLGINGIVNVTTPDIKQDNSLKQQASNFINAEQVVANSCLASRNNQSGKFVTTGNNGVAETPSHTNIPYEVVQIQPVAISTNAYKQENITSSRAWKLGDNIIEAKELRFTPSGRIVLSATTNKDNLPNTQSLTC